MKISIVSAILLATGSQLAFAAPTKTTSTTTKSSSTTIPQFSPAFPSTLVLPTDVPTSYNAGPYNSSATLETYTLKDFPEPWEIPDPSHPEVQAAYKKIDWSLVPKAPVRKQTSKGFVPNTDGEKDPYCWWSDTNCVTPKINIPQDVYECPDKKDWGLSYDDGPFNRYTGKDAATENPFAEPALYNFLLENNNQKASLFYIGSNVVTYPAAAKRAIWDGQEICVHTYSHQPMTTVTNEQAVAEFYWTLKAIKAATGVTPKCWRPPQGDVDDRIRSIAWQMGMRTVLWNWDSNDWDMPAPGGGDLPVKTVDGYFEGWVEEGKSGNLTTGHIVLEHELNHATVNMTMKWLPTLQKVFNVVPALACNGISQPYWEENFVYPSSGNMTFSTNGTAIGPNETASVNGTANATNGTATESAPGTTTIILSSAPTATA